jgi:3-hydroxyisobutyrate dehydrogenase-like beta-hydroxyacid dehydrogenase
VDGFSTIPAEAPGGSHTWPLSAFAEKHGVPRARAAEVLTTTPVMANGYRSYSVAIAAGKFSSPGFGLRLGHKDARLLLEAASALDVPMRPLT